jgi:hypothetical protein
MSRESNLKKKTVELEPAQRASRIRREPPPVPENALARKLGAIDWGSREWEIRLAIGGIIFFAVAISALVIDLGTMLSY